MLWYRKSKWLLVLTRYSKDDAVYDIIYIVISNCSPYISADTYSFIVLARTEEIEENYIIKELILKKFIAAISSSTEWIGVFVLGITTGTITTSLEATPESYNSLIGRSIIIPC
jgi:hypothetical protein